VNSSISAQRRTLGLDTLSDILRNQGIFVVLLVMVILCVLFVPHFATSENYINILKRAVPLGLVAIGQTFVIIGGSLDLSVDISISAIAVLTALSIDGRVENVFPAILLALVAGIAIGLVNGLIVTKLKINAFIATLGTKLLLQGILFSGFNNFAGKVPTQFDTLAYGTINGVPVGVILMFALALVAFVILRYTRFGHHLYAVGGNREVSRLSGVRTDRVIIGAHIFTGIGAAIAAIFIVSLLRSGGPYVGEYKDLDSISAVVVGGTPLVGGRGGVWGTLAGVVIVSILANVFNNLNVGAFAQQVVSGIVLIGVVAFYSFRLRK
jgi:ribose transport system permease protein